MDEDPVVKIGDVLEAVIASMNGIQCDFTKATIKLSGLTRRGACPPIVSRRCHRCPCGSKKRSGKAKAFKNCCGRNRDE